LAWGDGAPLVLVSGNLQAADDWVSAGYADVLDDFRVLAVDPLGYGESAKPRDAAAYRLEDRAADLDAVLAEEGISSATLWGYSFGAIQVEAYARLRQEHTRAVVLGGIVPALNATDRRNVGMGSIAVYESGDWDSVWRDAMPFVPVELRATWEERNDLAAVAASSRGSWDAHSADGGPLPTPLLCYVGSEEWFCEIARAMVDAAGADAAFVAVEGADHAGAFQDVETVTSVVVTFLRDNAPTVWR
jgi:pimeloyl-ACP methyl ester carboxylesterase